MNYCIFCHHKLRRAIRYHDYVECKKHPGIEVTFDLCMDNDLIGFKLKSEIKVNGVQVTYYIEYHEYDEGFYYYKLPNYLKNPDPYEIKSMKITSIIIPDNFIEMIDRWEKLKAFE